MKKPQTFAGINWTVRVRNPQFWFQIVIAIFAPILAYTGLTAGDFTSWGILWDTAIDAISNPYMAGLIAVSVYNAVNDPLTSGFTDSANARTYTTTNKEK